MTTGRSEQAATIPTGLAPSNDLESALVRTLSRGGYTAIVRSAGDTSGVALVEVFDAEATVPSVLEDISTRGPVKQVAAVMIGGVIVGNGSGVEGAASANLVLRE